MSAIQPGDEWASAAESSAPEQEREKAELIQTEQGSTQRGSLQDRYDDAMFDFSTGNYESAIAKFQSILAEDPAQFDAQLALGMAHYRKGDYAAAIAEGHKAERLKPHEQLVHTNLSLFYMKAGNKAVAEHHGLQARISSWRTDAQQAKSEAPTEAQDPELQLAKPKLEPIKLPSKFPDMPWKKKPSGH
jgi:predicted Zn-dependent protease